ncbi:hypothetical protein RJT34_02139 [Clitoria ternatea]|uniref:Uncharacterized protein n=1 Tax=Clitoria ternatea TaxID=43366 RepID=A0AAN9KIB7_CLITE
MSRSVEPPRLPIHSFRSSRRSVFSGNSSHHPYMDPDVIEIPPPTLNPPNLKQKEAVLHEVINIDNDDESADLVLVDEKVGTNYYGKAIKSIHDCSDDHQIMEAFDGIFSPHVMDKSGLGSGVKSSDVYISDSHNLIDVDGHDSNHSCDDDVDYSDIFAEEYMDVDNYDLLQAHFDNVDIPPGIEAPIPWLTEYDLGPKNTTIGSLCPWSYSQFDAKNSHVMNSSQPSLSLDPTNPEIPGPSAGSSSLQIKMDAIKHPSEVESSYPPLFNQTPQGKKKSDALQRGRRKLKVALGVESSKSNLVLGPSECKKKHIFYPSANLGFVNNLEAKKLSHGGDAVYWGHFENTKNATGSTSSHHSHFSGPVDGSMHFPGIEFVNNWWLKNTFHIQPLHADKANSSFLDLFVHMHAPLEQLFDNS